MISSTQLHIYGDSGEPIAVAEMAVDLDAYGGDQTLPRVWLVNSIGADIDMGTLRSHTRIISESVGATGSGAGAHCISRSYRHPFALIATHTDVLGVDIERVDPFDKDFAESICTPSEWSSDATRPRGAVELADVWSTKEALAKALGNALDYDPRRLVSLALAPNSRASTWQAARVSVPSGYVGWVIWRRSDAEQ